VIIVLAVYVLIWAVPYQPRSTGTPLPTSCLPESGYTCQTPSLHNNIITLVLSQVTNVNWGHTYLLYVPEGQNTPSDTNPFCPPPESNTISSGISCYAVNGLSSGESITANFTLSSPPGAGQTYSGIIWAVYQNTTGGSWHETQVTAEVVLNTK